MDRKEMLQQVLAGNPEDAFARYGLAMEHARAGEVETALAEYKTLLQKHPDYTAGYHMAAQMLAAAERVDEAKQFLRDGIAAAERTRNAHAKSEMQGMLEELGG